MEKSSITQRRSLQPISTKERDNPALTIRSFSSTIVKFYFIETFWTIHKDRYLVRKLRSVLVARQRLKGLLHSRGRPEPEQTETEYVDDIR